MGILTFAFILFMLPLDIIFITSVIYRPKTTKWEDISYRWAFLNNLSNPILYLALMKVGRRAVASLLCCDEPGPTYSRSVPSGSITTTTGHDIATLTTTSSFVVLPSPADIYCDLTTCDLCDYVAKDRTELHKHRKKHRDRRAPGRQAVRHMDT